MKSAINLQSSCSSVFGAELGCSAPQEYNSVSFSAQPSFYEVLQIFHKAYKSQPLHFQTVGETLLHSSYIEMHHC